MAPSTLKAPFESLVRTLEQTDPDLKVSLVISNGPSTLGGLVEARPGDLAAFWGREELERLGEKGLLDAKSAEPFARSVLAVGLRKGLKSQPTKIEDLGRPGLRLLAEPSGTPAGAAATRFLDILGKVDRELAGRLRANLHILGDGLTATEALLRGDGDAALVLAVQLANAKDLASLPLPDHAKVEQTAYLATIGSDGPSKRAARVVQRLMAPKYGQVILVKHGFFAASPIRYWSDGSRADPVGH